MKVSTLMFIHYLLQAEHDVASEARAISCERYERLKKEYESFSESEKNSEKYICTMQAYKEASESYVRCLERANETEEALNDFESHDFR